MPTSTTLRTNLYLILIAFASSSAIADIRSATGKPLLDFYTVYGALDSVKIIKELCNTRFPEFKKQNDLAYKQWRSRNREFIYTIEQYNHAIVTRTSKGNEAEYRKMMLETAISFEKEKVLMDEMFSGFGQPVYRSTCASYPQYLVSEKADFPNYYGEHMQVFENFWRKQR